MMTGNTKIEWADTVWNPVVGCTKVSEGCRHCYAEAMAKRLKAMGRPEYQDVVDEKGWTGRVCLVESRLEDPLHWRRPRRVFVNSMSDLFHEQVHFQFILRVWLKMRLAKQHTFLVLTKRPEKMYEIVKKCLPTVRGLPATILIDFEKTLPNVWLGVSVENFREMEQRVPLLMQTPAAVRFVSCEPFLEPVYLEDYLRQDADEINNRPFIQWVIVGGESGPNARPMHPDWARAVRDQCQAAGVPFFFKGWGEWAPLEDHRGLGFMVGDERTGYFKEDYPGHYEFSYGGVSSHGQHMVRAGRTGAGRLLDGREWNEFPPNPTLP